MMDIFSDINFALRTLIKNPKFTALTVFVMTTGLTLCIYMFSFIHGSMVAPLPFENGERIRAVGTIHNGMHYQGASFRVHDFEDLKKRVQSYEVFDAYDYSTVNLSTSDRAVRYTGHYVTENFFEISEAKPLFGRLITNEDGVLGAEPVVVISHTIWQNMFAGDKNILGKKLRINSKPTTVVGVMPDSYQFPSAGRVWMPFTTTGKGVARKDGHYVAVYGVLKGGVTDKQANAELQVLMAELAESYPKLNSNTSAHVWTLQLAAMGSDTPIIILAMELAVGFILLLACINVGNLLLSRATEKGKETAIRTALGAPRMRLVMQMMWESMLICVISGVLAVLFAGLWLEVANKDVLESFPFDPPFWWNIKITQTSLIAAVVITLVTAFITGILPALKATSGDFNATLRDGTRGAQSKASGRLSKVIVISEVVLSCALLLLSTGMVYSVNQQNTIDYGTTVEDIFTASVGLPEVEYESDEKRQQYYQNLADILITEPEISAVSFTRALPGNGASYENIALDNVDYGKKPQYPRSSSVGVAHNYFSVMEMNLREGRLFDSRDKTDSPLSAVVTDNFVNKFFKDGDVLGKRFKFVETDKDWYTVIGVVNDVIHGQPMSYNIEKPTAFISIQQTPKRFMSIVVKTEADNAASVKGLSERVVDIALKVERDAPLYNVKTLRNSITGRNAGMNFVSELFLVFAVASMVLAFSGIYGVMSNTIVQKTQEIGIRRALGADNSDIYKHFIKQGIKQLVIGLAIGLPMGVALVTMLEESSIAQGSLMLYFIIPAFISAVMLLAVYYPVQRALKMEPCAALRHE
jgi:putative ABC transport system permease protein